MNLHWLDIAVIVAYTLGTIGIGIHFSRRNESTERYFLGKRDFPGWAIGLSFIGSTISSVTFIAYPADSFKTAWLRLAPPLAFPLVVIFASYTFVPFFRSGAAHSAYHYLYLRFGSAISVYAASVYLLAQVVRAATITYLLSVLVASMTGLSVEACIVISGGVTALYTVKGGFEAVVWTDVVQTIVLLAGALTCVGFIVYAIPGGFFQIWSDAQAAGKMSFRDLNASTGLLEPVPAGFSLTEKTAAMMVLVGISNYLTGQLDQDSVQRWCSTKSEKEARKSMFILGLGAFPIWAGFMFLGTCLWVYYQYFPTEVSSAILAGKRKAEDILPHFIVTVLPSGLAGLVISAAMAAAMASLSSCINAAGMVWVNDFYKRFLRPQRADAHYLRIGRLTSLVISALAMGGAYAFYLASTKTILDFVLIVTALLGCGVSGAFLFGMLTRLGDSRSVLVGAGVTMIFTGYALMGQFGVVPELFNTYYTSVLGNVLMFGICCIAARVLPRRGGHLAGLTIWDKMKKAEDA